LKTEWLVNDEANNQPGENPLIFPTLLLVKPTLRWALLSNVFLFFIGILAFKQSQRVYYALKSGLQSKKPLPRLEAASL
jgi:hypothetical protein